MALTELPRRGRAIANDYGLTEALGGLLVGLILESIAEGAYDAVAHKSATSSSYGALLVGLLGLWVGFLAGAFAVLARQSAPARTGSVRSRLRESIGLSARWQVDLPLGVAVGLASQYLLVWFVSLPLLPFVPHLYTRLGDRANSLTSGVHGAGFVVLALFICLGSPVVEEIFRGVLLRGLLGAGRRRLRVGAVVAPVILDGVLFGLAHFEALQLIGLASFGVVLAVLAYRTGRLGAGMVAHVTFNTVTIIAIAAAR